MITWLAALQLYFANPPFLVTRLMALNPHPKISSNFFFRDFFFGAVVSALEDPSNLCDAVGSDATSPKAASISCDSLGRSAAELDISLLGLYFRSRLVMELNGLHFSL